jgi:DNA-binding NarL/FixJ family response regulator
LDEGPINVLLADDDEGFLTSLRELVDRQPELHVVAVARNGIEAIEYPTSTIRTPPWSTSTCRSSTA